MAHEFLMGQTFDMKSSIRRHKVPLDESDQDSIELHSMLS